MCCIALPCWFDELRMRGYTCIHVEEWWDMCRCVPESVIPGNDNKMMINNKRWMRSNNNNINNNINNNKKNNDTNNKVLTTVDKITYQKFQYMREYSTMLKKSHKKGRKKSHRRRREYRRIVTETKSRWLSRLSQILRWLIVLVKLHWWLFDKVKQKFAAPKHQQIWPPFWKLKAERERSSRPISARHFR